MSNRIKLSDVKTNVFEIEVAEDDIRTYELFALARKLESMNMDPASASFADLDIFKEAIGLPDISDDQAIAILVAIHNQVESLAELKNV